MGIFGSLFKLAVDVAITPLAVVKDVVTLGGAVTEEESATITQLQNIKEDLDELTD